MFGRCKYSEKGSQVQAPFITTLKKSVSEQNELDMEQNWVWAVHGVDWTLRALPVFPGHSLFLGTWTAAHCKHLWYPPKGFLWYLCLCLGQAGSAGSDDPRVGPELVEEELEVR